MRGITHCSCPSPVQIHPPLPHNQSTLRTCLYRGTFLPLWGAWYAEDTHSGMLPHLSWGYRGQTAALPNAWSVPRQYPVTYHFYLFSPTFSCFFGFLFFLLLLLFLFAQLLWWWSGWGWRGHGLLTFTL